MIRARKSWHQSRLLPTLLFLLLNGAASAETGEKAVDAIIASYQEQCQAIQAGVLPGIDSDLNLPPLSDILKVNEEDIFEIEIDLNGNKATVVHASFGCANFGRYWCGASGSCPSYLIVDDVVFEWEGGGRPEAVKGNDTVLVIKNISGHGCTDSMRGGGIGASPCYRFIVWDEKRATFWSADGHINLRKDLSPP